MRYYRTRTQTGAQPSKIMKAPPKKQKPARKPAINARQELFCQFVAAGDNQTEAYTKAGFKATREAARRNAARMLTKADIKARIKEILDANPDVSLAKMTKQEKLDILATLIRTPMNSEAVKVADKLRAIELHSKLLGHFEPDRKEIEFGNQALQSIRERAKELGFAMSKSYQHGTPAVLDD